MDYEHFRILFKETRKYLYYINSRGWFERFDKRLGSFNEKLVKRLKGNYSPVYREYRVKIQGKSYCVKREIAKHFSREYKPHSQLIIKHKDKDPLNCNIENLVFFTNSHYSKHYRGFLIKVVSKVGDYRKVFLTIKEAAQALFVNESTIKEYIHKRRSYNSILNPYQITLVKKKLY